MDPQVDDNNVEIICMSNSIKYFQFYGGLPPITEFMKPGKSFYFKFLFLAVASSLILVGSTLHLISNIQAKVFNHVELDVAYITAMLTGYILIGSFIQKMNVATILYKGFSNFKKFEKPINFDETNKKFNKYAKIHMIYLQTVIFLSLGGSNIVTVKQCRQENKEKHIHETCGLYTYTWMPFEIDYTPVRELYLLWQLLSAEYIYSFVGLCAWMVVESVEHVITRMHHVSYLFTNALVEKNISIRHRKFNFAVQYHCYVIGLANLLNETYTLFMMTHVIMTSAILGYGTYAFIRTKNISTFALALGWLNGLLMVCYGAQRLQDESLLIGDNVYNSNWTDCDLSIKKKIIFVLIRCQKKLTLKASYFGIIIEYPTFIAVLKAAYSYITLMNQTSNN